MDKNKYRDVAVLLLRLATAANFLSAVASRFGLWGGGNWEKFMAYATRVNSFAPKSAVPVLAITATVMETIIPILLIVGYKTRIAAFAAGCLTFLFAMAMTYSFGIKEPLDYGVFVDFTSAFVLATIPYYRWSIDGLLLKRENEYSALSG